MKKALIVDDNEQNLYLLQTMLKGQGYDVMTAASGAEALEQARRDPPDIVISDILMPVMDGFALCRKWQKDERLQTIPFVFYTATYTDPQDEDFALNLGAERFIRKPQEPEAFVGMLREVIEQHQAGHLAAEREAPAEETVYLKLYNETLIRKLEDKMEQLEGAKEALEQDVTERKRAEEALRGEREKLELVTQNIGAGLGIISRDYRTLWANNVLKRIFGDVEGKDCYLAYNKRTEICPGCGVQEVFKKGSGTFVHEQEGKDIEGNTIWSEIIATPIKDQDGNITAALELVIPITERKRAEQEMAFLQEQLRQSQKIEAIGRLAGGIAHDFNNLLTVIQGNAQLSLMDLQEGDPLRKNIDEIKRASERAAELTRQLLAFSRKQVMEMRILALNQVLQRLDKMLRRMIGEDIELETIPSESLGTVKADPGQMEQVVINLAVNARDAMPEGGKLTIETANVELDEEYALSHVAVTPGRYVMLSLSDTGVGITPEVKEKIFEPFFTTKGVGKGTGLGLSTVYGIVKQSGGNIWVYSEPGQGTAFKIYFPRVDEPVEELREEVVKEVVRGDETILVVEDEETVRKLAVRVLKRQGYKILEASEGGRALLLCEEFKDRIHLILTDVVMPGISGRKLVDRLKEIHPEMKVLYMSGYTDNAILHHGILEEGTNFIQKPFSMDGLARKVREVLDK